MTRSQTSIGGCGPASRPRTPRSTDTFSTRAPWGKSMPRKKMSLQPLCERSMRTAVRSTRIGNGCANVECRMSSFRRFDIRHSSFVLSARGGFPADGPPGGPCGTSTGCREPIERCGGPGRPGSGNRGLGRRRPGRWRWRRSVPAGPPPRGSRRSPLQTAGPADAHSRRTAPGPDSRAAVCPAGDSGRWRPGRRSPARARRGFRSGGGSRPRPAPLRPAR